MAKKISEIKHKIWKEFFSSIEGCKLVVMTKDGKYAAIVTFEGIRRYEFRYGRIIEMSFSSFDYIRREYFEYRSYALHHVVRKCYKVWLNEQKI